MTDDAENRDGIGGPAADVPPADAPPADASSEGSDTSADGDVPVDFGNLSLPQRAFVAAVQNPTRGVVIVGLLAFAFSFYVAFWFVFPRVAALLSAVGVVLVGVVALVYFVSGRFSR